MAGGVVAVAAPVATAAPVAAAPVYRYVVNSAADDANADPGSAQCQTSAAECTLRAAIQAADAGHVPAAISFDIPGTGIQLIEPATPLPAITVPVTIDGYTQPGSAWATASQVATMDVALVGPGRSPTASEGNGLDFAAGSSGSVLEGLSVSRFNGAGVLLQSDGDTVQGNDFGTPNLNGQTATSLALFQLMFSPGNVTGLQIDNGHGEQIGGTFPATANYVSQNVYGLVDSGVADTITGNVIGPPPTWAALEPFVPGNEMAGLQLQNAQGDTVSGNVVSSNPGYGVEVTGSSGTDIAGNLIGISPDGKSPMGNGTDDVFVSSSTATMIGGSQPSQRNVIAASNGNGVEVTGATGQGATIEGNYIGTDPTGQVTGDTYGNAWSSIVVSAPGTIIGGPLAGNVIDGSGQAFGGGPYADIDVTSAGQATVVQGNYVGLLANGQARRVDSGRGILSEAEGVEIGGTLPGDGNVVDTTLTSVQSDGVDNVIQGNLIGTDPTGTIGQLSSEFNSSAVEVTGSGTLVGGDSPQRPPITRQRICLPGSWPVRSCSPQLGARNVIDNVGPAGGENLAGEDLAIGTATTGATVNGVRVQGNLFGTDITGTLSIGTEECDVLVGDGAVDTEIGGTAPGDGNVVSASGIHGIQIGPDGGSGAPTVGTVVEGNLVGTDVTGARALPNEQGGVAVLAGSTGTVIGGAAAGAGNLISGNVGGIELQGGTGTEIFGNHIGTTAYGARLANSLYGVYVGAGAEVGSVQPGYGNVIADNEGPGVYVGPSVTGADIRGNSITANSGPGIELDPTVAAVAPAPTLNQAQWHIRQRLVTGTVSGAPSSTYYVDVYASRTPSYGAYAQGTSYLGSVAVTTDGSGSATFSLAVGPIFPWEGVFTATATTPDGSTSQFSAPVPTDPYSR